ELAIKLVRHGASYENNSDIECVFNTDINLILEDYIAILDYFKKSKNSFAETSVETRKTILERILDYVQDDLGIEFPADFLVKEEKFIQLFYEILLLKAICLGDYESAIYLLNNYEAECYCQSDEFFEVGLNNDIDEIKQLLSQDKL